MKTLVQLVDVGLTYQTTSSETLAIHDVNLSIHEGEFVAIVGPSGCGKTTILSLIAGILKPSTGKVLIDGKIASEQTGKTGYMFQRDQLFGWRTIYKNIVLGLEIKKDKDKTHYEYAKNLLKKYGLSDFEQNYPAELSGGMRQRAALIRTLTLRPSVLLLDEPFSALDYQTRLSVCNDVSNIIRQEGQTAVLVTHDLSEAISMADRVVVLSKRPATIKKVFNINLKSQGSPLNRREHPDFAKLFDKIWKELNDEK